MSAPKKRSLLLILGLLLFAALPSLADQTATFRCQATQGTSWQGISQVTAERIDITILPDHLDVEHELVIDARSPWAPPSHPNTVEILGDINMAKGTVITGLLLWNGDKILKGKLLTEEMARRRYEEVVDRNVKDPPPPRDPAILEKTGENTYALSIFPVSLNGSRKIRIRYLIPSSFQNAAHRITFPHAFSNLAKLSLRSGPGISGYALNSVRTDGTAITVKNEDAFDAPLALDPDAFQRFRPPYRHFEEGTGAWLRHVTPLFGALEGSRVSLGSMRDYNGSTGHVAHFILRPPEDFLNLTSGPGTRVFAVIRAGADSVQKEVNDDNPAQQGAEELRIFSSAPLEDSITWRMYTGAAITDERTEKPHRMILEDGAQYARSFGATPFYPLARHMPSSLAAAWGFIDSKYALLALERDTLNAAVALEYAKAGVPGLDPGDIFPEDGKIDSVPLSAWALQRNFNRDELLQPIAIAAQERLSGIRWRFRDGRVLVEIDKAALARIPGGLRVSLHGLDGKLLKTWGADEISQGRLSWSPRDGAYTAGICLLRIVSGSRTFSYRIILR